MTARDRVIRLAERYIGRRGFDSPEELFRHLIAFGMKVRRDTLKEERDRNNCVKKMFKEPEAA